MTDVSSHEPMLLWPDGAPHATGTEPTDCPTLAPYLIDSPEPKAAVIVCPGGGYNHLAEHESGPIAEWLVSLGVASFVLKYRLQPYTTDESLMDAQRAIRTVRANAKEWNIDPERIGILGFSAGGHLVCRAATEFASAELNADDPIDNQSSRPDAIVACYAATTRTGKDKNSRMKENVGDSLGAWANTPGIAANVTPETPTAFLWHTSDDPVVPVECSLIYAEALHRASVPFALHVFPHGRHGLGLCTQNPEINWTELCGNWLTQIGFRN